MKKRSVKISGNNIVSLLVKRARRIDPNDPPRLSELVPGPEIKARIYKFELNNPLRGELPDENELLKTLNCTVSQILNYKK